MQRLALLPIFLTAPLNAAPDGAALYQQSCSICHGLEGQGVAGVFPPLAKSDFLTKHRERALAAPMEGLSGTIEVNGTSYHGAMPPAVLDDAQLTAVFNHILTSWGNTMAPATIGEIAKVRAGTRFPTFDSLKASMATEKLPDAPAGWKLDLGVELSFSPTRLALHADGEHVLALSSSGDVWWWKPGSPLVEKHLPANSYIPNGGADEGAMGMTVDSKGRLYIACNKRDLSTTPVLSRITIYRTEPWSAEQPWSAPKPWFTTTTPYGIGGYNHGVSHIAEGPDGQLYINSGARTDTGEAGEDPKYSTAGEAPNTATIWRLDPNDPAPADAEIHARGLRNSYGFCWDDEKRMIATENGPNAHAPEELNLIEQGKHYGFPFRYSDVTTKFYPHQPDLPAGIAVTLPFRNLGPDGGGSENGLATFDPHSCPTGLVWLDKSWPAPLGGSFLTTRFGNMMQLVHDVGFDLLQLHVDFGQRTVRTHRLISPMGRPVDLIKLSGHRLVIAEYTRATSAAAGMGTPGRLLLLQPSP